MHTLSKSDFKLARTCPTKLYYREAGYPDNTSEDPYLELLAEGGYMVELLAKQQFPEGVTLLYGGDPVAAARETAAQLAKIPVTLFEATLLHEHRLARLDILRRTPAGFDLFEVKSSSYDREDGEKRRDKTGSPFKALTKPHAIATAWREYLEDVTYQVLLLKALYPGVPVNPHLILVDKQRAAAFDDMPSWFHIVRSESGRVHTAEFLGKPEEAVTAALTVTLDVSNEVAELEEEVRLAAESLAASLQPTLKRLPSTLQNRCRDCEFRVEAGGQRNGFAECWGPRADHRPHVLELYQGRTLLQDLIDEGVSGLLEIDALRLEGLKGNYASRQLVQVRQSRANQEWVNDGLSEAMAAAEYPLHFIDFEAGGLAIPHHKGMHPHGRLAWQWSCHIQATPAAEPAHREFINTERAWPNEQFARSLRQALGDHGSILTWSTFEGSILRATADELQARGNVEQGLIDWLRAVSAPQGTGAGRVIDMLALCRAHYFHPLMGGSNSIKVVLDAVWRSAPEVRRRYHEITGREGDPKLGPYAALPPLLINGKPQVVAEGTGAIRAYFAMTYGAERDDQATKLAWRKLLLDYCELDTLAMVLIWEHWLRCTEAGPGA